VFAVLIFGRVIHPEFSEEAAALWKEQRATQFDFGRCCLGRF
jgi:hypothetical protein